MKLGKTSCYSGIQVQNIDGIYHIHQEKQIKQILETYELKNAKDSIIPLNTGYEKIEDLKQLTNVEQYQSLIGSFMYVATSTRPDIAASVAILSRKLKVPSETDWTEAKRVAKYLKGTAHYKLRLGEKQRKSEEKIGYVDANWAESRIDRKSNTGYLFQYNKRTISWACRKQTCVALSSTEAEFVALSEGCQEGLWLTKLLTDFGEKMKLPTRLYEDN